MDPRIAIRPSRRRVNDPDQRDQPPIPRRPTTLRSSGLDIVAAGDTANADTSL